jgi:AcrR family transcriptional regulator
MKPKVQETDAPLSGRRNREPEIRQAALAIFAEKGYGAASVQEVADRVGVLKGSLYHYIDSKEDLLFQIFEAAHKDSETMMQELDALDLDPVERLRTYLERGVSNTLENLELQALYFRDWRYLTGERRAQLVERRRQYDRYLRNLIDAAYKHKGLSGTVNPRFVASFVIGGTNWVADWYTPDGQHSAAEVARSYADLALAAVLGVAEPAKTKRGSQSS